MDKIGKALARLTKPERAMVAAILRRLLADDLVGLDVKKLKGHTDIFRVRKGSIRIIYRRGKGETFILVIERRTEATYRKWQLEVWYCGATAELREASGLPLVGVGGRGVFLMRMQMDNVIYNEIGNEVRLEMRRGSKQIKA